MPKELYQPLRRMEERAAATMSGNEVPVVEHTPDAQVRMQFGDKGYRQPRFRVWMTAEKVFSPDTFGA